MDESVPVHLVDESVPFSFPLIIGLIVVLLTFFGGEGGFMVSMVLVLWELVLF